eukprot:6080081-Lingulodinium_polyedra.AAC.1
MECANVRFGSGCGNETVIQPRRSAAFVKRCAMMRSKRHFDATAARAPQRSRTSRADRKSVRAG